MPIHRRPADPRILHALSDAAVRMISTPRLHLIPFRLSAVADPVPRLIVIDLIPNEIHDLNMISLFATVTPVRRDCYS